MINAVRSHDFDVDQIDGRCLRRNCIISTVSRGRVLKLNTAKNSKCAVIVMASHGRRGISALLLGSETQKVLTHSKLPVIVVL